VPKLNLSKACIIKLCQFKFVIHGVGTKYYVIDMKCYNIFCVNVFIFMAITTIRTLHINLPCTTCFGSFGHFVGNLRDVERIGLNT
jgi:hypothetical protein